ncbi:hypothetical protein M5D96_012900 [Drosophila gunungcola]|uniref:Uncharacterized protein n=1 Tax=Drosophila gunungcola TaxID=103775 RepID=A0A9P9YC87_9MUSC|nr:hypothetical protein M5D96_012900 [Drosophila gunungcola]
MRTRDFHQSIIHDLQSATTLFAPFSDAFATDNISILNTVTEKYFNLYRSTSRQLMCARNFHKEYNHDLQVQLLHEINKTGFPHPDEMCERVQVQDPKTKRRKRTPKHLAYGVSIGSPRGALIKI